jgi:hypothetical protein
MGLDHLTGRSGRIFRAVHHDTGWYLAPVAVLDAEPGVWLVEGKTLLFLTQSGLWSADATGGPQRLYEADLGDFSPTSLVRGRDGALYIGLRYYVLRLAQAESHWSESWYVPAACQKVRLNDYRCECVN